MEARRSITALSRLSKRSTRPLYDAQGMGNREFPLYFPLARGAREEVRHPLLCSNLVDARGRALPFARELVLEREGFRLRLFSLLVVQYPAKSPWEHIFGWRFLDPIEVAREVAARTAPDESLIVLSHLGLRADRALAAAVPRLISCWAGIATICCGSPST